ncbi:hypothetical protein B0A52_06461 [Exophiala mesophila]|uniref:Zinc finger PHD-type domain-containing protein n=1 Tax=Exophiala mesophila TaxID=212818 RepID=A0A438N2B3_EXOME|nr:hypothetical protein B0A52_06461 [Exophiala mesophila]
MSPRRSSRARSSQQPPSGPNHTSSTSSNSGKLDRDIRSHNRTNSPRPPSTQRSESVDGVDSSSRSDQIAPRRSRRNGEDKEAVLNNPLGDDDIDIDPTEEEVTRCICEQSEYPGPSATIRQNAPNAESLTEETGNFFVQCDSCSVWQHGGCMGLLDESMLPEEYYCELCKPRFHKITKNANGLKSSHYLPVLEPSSQRSSPSNSNTEQSRKRETKKATLESTKRRATMNSRSTFEEAEAVRRSIEDSKEVGTLGKRTRDESEDLKQNAKRPRTGSNSSSAPSKRSESPEAEQDDSNSKSGLTNRNTNQSSRRGIPNRNNKDKEIRDKQKEQQAAQRAEAASKRNARSERRRGEDSPPPSPSVSPSKAAQISGKAKADSPSSGKASSTRKTGRPPARRGRLVRNQYTRDQTNGDNGTPLRDIAYDLNGNGTSPNGINGESGRSSKAKTHPARTSLNEMKRRVAAILEFVGHMQTEKASQSNQDSGSGSSKGANTPNGVKSNVHLPTASLVKAVEAGLKDSKASEEDGSVHLVEDKDFGQKGSVEMMETLTRELVSWQSVYGTYSR